MQTRVGDLDITIEPNGERHRFVVQGRPYGLASDVDLGDLERLERELACYRTAEAEKLTMKEKI